ncbi:4-(cytidine 5'-diphospho)-2-C-methyl-D-erythritol kinase [Stakelama marina]|uniref:4-diphosphocytidyl-2-C-methyl-D-erythritol kinase n=1 Tax=Stakelama marina TaxID=2826939 RepID=A0A8T4IG89_9SPHN|nr:4-(cytidine 5'-diphospho)-2-C-methyl-D-erythritol kinase [Stakelama marina]MBR0551246.1 4-(cytidine 5'-diphospho)-2-C-methyl-D-erythritol kinase [Stakelama marina]
MMIEPARAKLNLALHIRGKREDGYHELETLFAFVEFGDKISVDVAEEDRLAITGPYAEALTGLEGDNLVCRARDLFRERFGIDDKVAITLAKHLPVASGIGGGSADAAATLRAMARQFGIATDHPELMRCAETLGSDVPACLFGRTAIGRGRGEKLEAVDDVAGIPALLVNPGVAVSTPAVFARWSGEASDGLAPGRAIQSAMASRNDLQPPAIALQSVIGDVIKLLDRQQGARLVRMSGSGATCFALFARADECHRAAANVRAAQPGWWCSETALA